MARCPESSMPGAFAIVGAALRCPGAETLEEFWSLITECRETMGPVPENRFSQSAGEQLHGCFINNAEYFDARFFNFSPREAAQIDPAQRLILLTAFDALQSAGLSRERVASQKKTVGTFFGITGDDYREAHAANNIDFAYVTGGVRAFGPGRLSHFFKFDGPSYCIDTACSASAACMQLAISSIVAGDCDTAVVGGANVLAASEMFAGLHRGGFLSSSGGCKSFLEDADGYCRGEAVGCVIIKRLQQAETDNDHVLAVISACKTNHSSRSTSIVQPHIGTQEELFRDALHAARLRPIDIDYIEMHGTGTQLGDAAESSSVSRVFLDRPRPANRQLYVGSVKPNIGHGEAASGVCSLIKAMLTATHKQIPRLMNADRSLNPKLPSEFCSAIPESPQPIHSSTSSILVNNFGAAGSNTAIILRSVEPAQDKPIDPRSHFVLTASGKDLRALKSNLNSLIDYVQGNRHARLQDVAYTATARREHFRYRVAVSCSSVSEAVTSLLGRDEDPRQTRTKEARPIVFAFQGQGDSITGKGQELFTTSPAFRESVLMSSKICEGLGLPPWLDLLIHPSPGEVTSEPALAQAAFQLALCDMLQSWGITPDAVVGHSLGEFPAACAAGALSRSDMFALLGRRALLLSEKCQRDTHSMLVIHTDVKTCRSTLSCLELRNVEVACDNGVCTVIAGPKIAINAAKIAVEGASFRTTALEVPYGYHSQQMDPILDELSAASSAITFTPVKVAIASTVTGSTIEPGQPLPTDYFRQQTRQEVRFRDAISLVMQERLLGPESVWLGIGQSSSVCAMLKPLVGRPDAIILSTLSKSQPHWKSITAMLAALYENGFDIDWTRHHSDYESHLALLDLPKYALDLKPFWLSALPKATSSKALVTSVTHAPVQQIKRLPSTTLIGDVSDPRLRELIQGHAVHGSAICSTSVFADMAYSVVSRMPPRSSGDFEAFSLDDFSVQRPLILRPHQSGRISMTASARTDSLDFDVDIASELADTRTQHVTCKAVSGNSRLWRKEWARLAPLVKTRVDTIKNSDSDGHTDMLGRRMVYNLFKSIVDYSCPYQGLDKVWLTPNFGEAAGIVRFKTTRAESSDFFCCPYWLDPLLHISGFALNGSEQRSADHVYVAKGWDSLKIASPLQLDEEYTCYVQMVPEGTHTNASMTGDVYVFDACRSVALVCSGITFQRLPRRALDELLPARNKLTVQLPPIDTSLKLRRQSSSKPSTAYDSSSSRTTSSSSVATAITPETPPTPLTQPPSPLPTTMNICEALAEVTGVEIAELTDETSLIELGVDSMMTLALNQSLKERGFDELPMDLLLRSETVKDLHEWLVPPLANPSHQSTSPQSDEVAVSLPNAKGAQIGLVAVVLETIAHELQLETRTPPMDVLLSDLGIDSMLATIIMDSVFRQTGIQLPLSLFIDDTNLGDLASAVGVLGQSAINQVPTSEITMTPLKQNIQPSSRVLFLLPDGSGALSPKSYGPLGARAKALASLADFDITLLSCSLADALAMQTLEDLTLEFARAIQKCQSRGPYFLGGWSVGGTFALECARHLSAMGERVAELVLIDAPCFSHLPPMNTTSIQTLTQLGIFGDIEPAQELQEQLHEQFHGTIGMLKHYAPSPLPLALKVTAVWAQQGVIERVPAHKRAAVPQTALNEPGVAWLLQPRAQAGFERTGWTSILLNAAIAHLDVPGDHFSMMRMPHVTAVVKAISAIFE